MKVTTEEGQFPSLKYEEAQLSFFERRDADPRKKTTISAKEKKCFREGKRVGYFGHDPDAGNEYSL